MIPDAEDLLHDSNPVVREVMSSVYDYFVEVGGCSAYVKTIYIGFELNAEMVAAAYPHAASIEVALALADDTEGAGLVDATHLTWRTMPVAVEIDDLRQLQMVLPYFATAVDRVRSGAHDVELSQDRFMGRERRLANRRILGRRPDADA